MPDSIKVGSAEFQMLMNLPAFKQAVEKEAPDIAKSGANKVAVELEKGAKKGADAQIREIKRASAEMEKATQTQRRSASQFSQGGFVGGIAQGLGIGTALEVVNNLQRAFSGVADNLTNAVKLQSELNAKFGEGTVQLGSFTKAGDALNGLGKATESLGNTFAVVLGPAIEQTTKLAIASVQAIQNFLEKIAPPTDEVKKQREALEAFNKANDPEALQKQAKAAQEQAKKETEAIQDKEHAQIAAIDNQKKAIESYVAFQKQKIEATREAQIRASQDAEVNELRVLETQQKASQRYYQEQIQFAEHDRDVKKQAVGSTAENALRIIDEETNARASARRQEDRDRDRADTAEQRSLEQRQRAAERALDAEQNAIERKRDTALKAIDDERDAEDRRHSQVLDDLQAEEDARLGAVDEQLKALSRQEQAERRRDSLQRLQQGVGEAKQGLAEAKRSGDPRAVARAQKDLNRAVQDLDRERRDEQRQDLRQSLEDQKDSIRKEIDTRRAGETDKTEAVKAGLKDRADAAKGEADKALEDLKARKQQLADQEVVEKQALTDAQTDRDTALAVKREKEDIETEAVKKSVNDRKDLELKAINETYDAPGGVIDQLHKAERDQADTFEREKLKIQDRYIFEQRKILETANYQLTSLDIMSKNLYNELEKQKGYWTLWALHAQRKVQEATGQAGAPQPVQGPVQPPGIGSGPLYGTGSLGTSPLPPRNDPLPKLAGGGMIREPTLLTSLRSGRAYGIAGEAGIERIVPGGGMGGVSIHMPISISGANIQDQDRLATVIVDRATAKLVHLLDSTHKTAGSRIPPTIPGGA